MKYANGERGRREFWLNLRPNARSNQFTLTSKNVERLKEVLTWKIEFKVVISFQMIECLFKCILLKFYNGRLKFYREFRVQDVVQLFWTQKQSFRARQSLPKYKIW